MKVEPTAIAEVKILVPVRHRDERGFLSETWNRRALEEMGLDLEFVQDNHSLSVARGSVRGLHFQVPPHAQHKLVHVSRGSVFDVAVDIRSGSPTYGGHVATVLSAEKGNQILIPVGFAHGFCTMEPDTEVLYKVTGHYSREHDMGLAWDDPDLGIEWPVSAAEAVLSERDRRHPRLRDLPDYFPYETG